MTEWVELNARHYHVILPVDTQTIRGIAVRG